MKAVVWHGVGDIRIDDVAYPKIQAPTDAIVRLTSSAICGTDLHMVRGTMEGMVPGTILGHEGVGIVDEVGEQVTNFRKGDRVVIPSTIACGSCSYCRAGYTSQCDVANPNGPQAGTAFFGGPKTSGPFNGMQAEAVRVPFANFGLVKLPENVSDEQAIILSDIYTTGYFGADLADIRPSHTVAVFGCGPVGQCAVSAAFLMGAGRVFAIDCVPSRLEAAAAQGAEIIDFTKEDPVQALRSRTNGIGVDRVIDAVGIDAISPDGKAAKSIGKSTNQWTPGDAPAQALTWAVQGLAKGGNLAIIGVYPETAKEFPIGIAMNRNITIHMGNCNHRKYLWQLVSLVKNGTLDPQRVISHQGPVTGAIEAYHAFEQHQPGWLKVELDPKAGSASTSQQSKTLVGAR